MSAAVQLNFIVKSIAGLVTAGMSDHIGRRPVTLICLSLLLVDGFKDFFFFSFFFGMIQIGIEVY